LYFSNIFSPENRFKKITQRKWTIALFSVFFKKNILARNYGFNHNAFLVLNIILGFLKMNWKVSYI